MELKETETLPSLHSVYVRNRKSSEIKSERLWTLPWNNVDVGWQHRSAAVAT